jgi:inner membrane transporter RhtA
MDMKVDVAIEGGVVLAPRGDVQPKTSGISAGALFCLLSMSSVQLGAALSSPVISAYGVAGATWLRLAVAAVILLLAIRPQLLHYSRAQWASAVLLGATTAFMTLAFFAAIRHLPLGLAVAIDFLGPLSVAAFGYGLSKRLGWPVLAGAGVLFLSHDSEGWVGDLAGVLYAVGAAFGWAVYILLTKKVGSAFKGLEGLSMSLMAASLVSLPFGLPQVWSTITPAGLGKVIGLAVLVPLLPYALEMVALRRMPASSFGILMSLEPAIGALAGFLILAQPMTLLQTFGTGLVVLASLGASFTPEGRQ